VIWRNQITGYVVPASEWNKIVNNFNALNAFLNVPLWPGKEAKIPYSGITGAGVEVAESSGAGTAKPLIPALLFDDSADEGRAWIFRMARGFGVTPTLVGSYKMASANTSKVLGWDIYLAAVSDGNSSHSAKVFDTVNTLSAACPDAADESDEFSHALTNVDSMAALDWVCLMLVRDTGVASNATGDVKLTSLSVNYSLAS
jgi:hypothetical protein